MPRETLEDRVLFYARHSCNKHGLAPDCDVYAERQINAMSNSELLNAISNAIKEMREVSHD